MLMLSLPPLPVLPAPTSLPPTPHLTALIPQAIPVETAKQNPNVALVLTSYGGHIGFLEGIWPRQCTYMDRVFKQFVQAMVEHGHELNNM